MIKVPLTFKKMEIVDYDPQLDLVKVRILFHDGRAGKDKAFVKQIKIEDPAAHIAGWAKELRSLLREQHAKVALDDHPLAGHVVFTYTQEEDKVFERMTKFLMHMRERIRSSRLARESYYDLQLKIKDQKVVFTV